MSENLKNFIKTFTLSREERPEGQEYQEMSSENSGKKSSSSHQSETFVSTEVKRVSYITSGLVVDGSISANDDMVIEGVVNGNVTCDGNVTVYGEVNGNIEGCQIDVFKATIKGNVIAQEVVKLVEGRIEGDISSNEVDINGEVTGNIESRSFCNIQEMAVINGDISAASMSVTKNSIINGKLSIVR